MTKQQLNAMPIRASDFERVAGEETSERIALKMGSTYPVRWVLYFTMKEDVGRTLLIERFLFMISSSHERDTDHRESHLHSNRQ